MESEELLSTREAAARAGVSDARIRQLIAEGKISAIKVGRDHVIRAQDLATVTFQRRAGRPKKQEDLPS